MMPSKKKTAWAGLVALVGWFIAVYVPISLSRRIIIVLIACCASLSILTLPRKR